MLGDRYRVTVRDQGPGVAPEVLEKIFAEFHQGEEGTRRTFGGLGVGLAIVQRLVSAMGGTINVTSELGVGSIFVVEVPLVPARVAAAGRGGGPR